MPHPVRTLERPAALPRSDPRWWQPGSPSARKPQNPEVLARAVGFRRIAGVDEAGRGPWAGPVVAAAAIPGARRLRVRIDDSKRLTARQRQRAFHAILRHCDVGIGIACAEEIDRDNILRACLRAMHTAVSQLTPAPDLVLIDGTIAPQLAVRTWTVIDGDALSVAIACASIVAKVVRDDLMAFYHRLYPAYGFDQHKGYGTAVHAEALASWGPSFIHRHSFRPVWQHCGPAAEAGPSQMTWDLAVPHPVPAALGHGVRP